MNRKTELKNTNNKELKQKFLEEDNFDINIKNLRKDDVKEIIINNIKYLFDSFFKKHLIMKINKIK